MATFFKKLIPHNIAAIIGIIQLIVPLVKEIIIAVIRIIDILTPDQGLEPVIVRTAGIFDSITAAINKFKNMFLGL
jgi:multisubunit Na+/H+ antiporter MnhE subunit